jgi:hypothetical protein
MRTPCALIGVDALPRRPRPSNAPGWLRPSCLASTNHSVLGPSAASGLLDQT